MIIGFTGLAGSGKSTAAMHLASAHKFQRLRFAGALKLMLHAMHLTPEETDGSLKEEPCSLLDGKTPRYAMQTLGTEWGRDLISPDLWVNVWRREVGAILFKQPKADIVVDDVRFDNEVHAILELGGIIVRITRYGVARASGHASEDVPDFCTAFVMNTKGTVSEFQADIDSQLDYWRRQVFPFTMNETAP
jgi:hypothetical protein